MLRNLYVYPPSEKPIDICSRSEPASRLSDDVAHLQIVNAVIKIAPQLKSLMKSWWWNLFFFLPEMQGAVSWHETFLCSQCCSKCEGWDTHDRSLCNWWAYKDSPTCLVMINKDRAKISYARGGVRTHRRARALMHARTKWKSQVWRQLGPPGKSFFIVMIKMGSKSPHRNYTPCEKKEWKKKEKQGDDGLAAQRPPLLPPFILSLVIVDRFSAWLKISVLRRLLLTEKCMQSMKCAGLRLQKKEKEKIRLIFHLIFSLLPTSEWVAFFMKWEAGYFLDRLSSGPHISRSHSALK